MDNVSIDKIYSSATGKILNVCLVTFESPQMSLVFSLYEGKLLSRWAPNHTKNTNILLSVVYWFRIFLWLWLCLHIFKVIFTTVTIRGTKIYFNIFRMQKQWHTTTECITYVKDITKTVNYYNLGFTSVILVMSFITDDALVENLEMNSVKFLTKNINLQS